MTAVLVAPRSKPMPPEKAYRPEKPSILPSFAFTRMTWNKAIGKRLMNIRISKGMTQDAVYLTMVDKGYKKVSQLKISRLESGWTDGDRVLHYRSIDLTEISAILEAMDYTLTKFLEENSDCF